MQIRWSPEAANDLSQIVQRIREQNPGLGCASPEPSTKLLEG
jgi:hypothetical protein